MPVIPDNEVAVEELYACPENVLEIVVRNPQTHGNGNDRFTDYEVVCRVQFLLFC
jgi:sorting nexin-3/12